MLYFTFFGALILFVLDFPNTVVGMGPPSSSVGYADA